MKNQKSFPILFGAFLMLTVVLPADADPVPECTSAEFSAVTADQKSTFVSQYGNTVSEKYANDREKIQERIDWMKEKDMCSERFPRYFGNIVCVSSYRFLDKLDERIVARKDDCGKLLDHLSTPDTWDKLVSCSDDADSTKAFREQTIDCTGDGICGEIHDLVDRTVSHASTPSQAVEQMPRCLGDLYQDIYGNTTSAAKSDIMKSFTVPTGW